MVVRVLLVMVFAVMCGGCQTNSAPPPLSAPAPAVGQVYFIEFPGISGATWLDALWTASMAAGGVGDRHEIYDWTSPNKHLAALTAYTHNRAAARAAAEAIACRKKSDPDARFVLGGWSGGAAVAVWTLEYLPPDIQVDDVVLGQGAVDPDHDLTQALAHVRGHVFVGQSPGDFVILGAGTTIFGTADGGTHTPSAGLVGFRRPANADAGAYRKLVPLPYQLQWMFLGDFGDHVSAMSPLVALGVIAPMVRDDLRSLAPKRVASVQEH